MNLENRDEILALQLFFLNFCCTGFSLLRRLFSSCNEQGLLSTCNTRASHCGGLSCGAQALGECGL